MSFWDRLPSEYQDVRTSFRLYWKSYGNSRALFRSPYFHAAIVLSFISYPIWWNPASGSTPWYDVTLTIFPNLMGFTLGGYAILLAFGNEEFLSLISGSENADVPSPFMVINGALVHFILLQGLAILVGFVCKSWGISGGIVAGAGCLVSIYALLAAIAATMAILRVADKIDVFRSKKK